MVEFDTVVKVYNSRAVLNGVSLSLSPGEIHFVLGKSGAGKSVLLRHITELAAPDNGRVLVDGLSVDTQDPNKIATIQRLCGAVFQFPALFDFLDVAGNICFAIRTMPDAERGRHLQQLLEDVGLAKELATSQTKTLSYSTQKLVAIARALAPRPKYLLFDEPTTGLDPVAARAVDRLIVSLKRDSKLGCLVVSHDVRAAFEIADTISVLDEARIVAQGAPAEVSRSRSATVRAFMQVLGSRAIQ